MSISMGGVRNWIDSHLVAIGFAFLFLGTLLTILDSVRVTLSINAYVLGDHRAMVSVPGLIVYVMSELASPLLYNSVFLISVGLLLRNWRVVIVGFENTPSAELTVDGPDEDKVVWVGKRYANALEADLAVHALSKRLTRVP